MTKYQLFLLICSSCANNCSLGIDVSASSLARIIEMLKNAELVLTLHPIVMDYTGVSTITCVVLALSVYFRGCYWM